MEPIFNFTDGDRSNQSYPERFVKPADPSADIAEVAFRKPRSHFAAQVILDRVGHEDRAAFALEVARVELGGVQDTLVERRQAPGRFCRHYSKVERNIETVLTLLFLLPGKFCEFPIGRGFVLKEEPLSLAIDFVAIQIVFVRPVSVVRDDAQLPAGDTPTFA